MTCVRVGRGRSRGWLCIPDTTTLVDPNPSCPNAAAHEPFPASYVAASEHAEKLMETHTQRAPCPGCGRWLIWTPR